jgi:8-oxo-dGTP diphosphatase
MPASEQGASHTDGRWLSQCRTLCFVRNGADVLLMKRAAHKRIFPNRYNGVGGHVERGEDVATCARREILEETGLTVGALQLCAIYTVDAGGDTGITVFAFTAYSSSRAFTDSDEGALEWVALSDVLSRDLVEDLPHTLTRMMAMGRSDAPFYVHLSYNERDEMELRMVD